MDQAAAVEELIAPILEELGFGVVRVRLTGTQRRTLQVMAERTDGGDITVDDCATMSRAISATLDVEDPIDGSYVLEVSSPGIDRPLVRREDFVRFAGFEAKLEAARPVAGRRRLRGRLQGVEDDAVAIDIGAPDGVVRVPIEDVRAAQLILTDELVAASLKGTQGRDETC